MEVEPATAVSNPPRLTRGTAACGRQIDRRRGCLRRVVRCTLDADRGRMTDKIKVKGREQRGQNEWCDHQMVGV